MMVVVKSFHCFLHNIVNKSDKKSKHTAKCNETINFIKMLTFSNKDLIMMINLILNICCNDEHFTHILV